MDIDLNKENDKINKKKTKVTGLSEPFEQTRLTMLRQGADENDRSSMHMVTAQELESSSMRPTPFYRTYDNRTNADSPIANGNFAED